MRLTARLHIEWQQTKRRIAGGMGETLRSERPLAEW